MSTTTPRIIRAAQVAERLGISRTTVWRWVQEGRLPQPTRYGRNTTGWREADINTWIARIFDESTAIN